MAEKQLVCNRVLCLACGKTLESFHRHDYKTCECSNQAMVDGGLDYVRYGAVDMDRILPTTVYSDDPFDIVRQSAYRKHLTGIVVRLSQMSDEWLAAAYKWDKERRGCTWHVKLMEKEIKYRAKKKITVTEEEFQKYTGVTPEQTRRIRSVLGDMVRTTPSQSSVREEARKRAAIVSLRSPFRKE